MLEKISGAFHRFCQARQARKLQKKTLTDREKRQLAFYELMQSLYKFVRWLDGKGFQNRKERKQFWRNVASGQPVLIETIKNLMNKYAPAEKKETDVTTTEDGKAEEMVGVHKGKNYGGEEKI